VRGYRIQDRERIQDTGYAAASGHRLGPMRVTACRRHRVHGFDDCTCTVHAHPASTEHAPPTCAVHAPPACAVHAPPASTEHAPPTCAVHAPPACAVHAPPASTVYAACGPYSIRAPYLHGPIQHALQLCRVTARHLCRVTARHLCRVTARHLCRVTARHHLWRRGGEVGTPGGEGRVRHTCACACTAARLHW
jgi:hypothetical protein